MSYEEIDHTYFASYAQWVALLYLKVALRERITVLKASVAKAISQPLTFSDAECAIIDRALTRLLVEMEQSLPPFPERDEILREGQAFRAYIMSGRTPSDTP